MRLVGEIVRLQIQSASLKVGQAPRRRYNPAPIRAVHSLRLDPGGATGLSEWGDDLEDVHHATHPASKHRGTNGLSVLFTGHYAAIRDRFGPHLTDGIAGENVLVAFDELLGEDDLSSGLLVETAIGGSLTLSGVIVAAPCVEFARYALRYPDDERPDRTVTEAVQFLDDGMRGYYTAYIGPAAIITVGDKVYVLD
ncbi:MAG TPA: hypothetical protein VMP03_07610 [Methylomirabilota bacterium]|nr:hypothetical protein [Methylomirabilota bacterium]